MAGTARPHGRAPSLNSTPVFESLDPWSEAEGADGWCPGHYYVTVSVTDPSSGRTLNQQQFWPVTEQNGQDVFEVESTAIVPNGAGTITETPRSCTFPTSLVTSVNWVL